MGCFDMTCGLSGLDIQHCDRTGLVFLQGNDFADFSEGPVYADDWFRPVGAPVYGIYDDYGTLEDIEQDESTAEWERLLGLPIQEIVNLACRFRDATEEQKEALAKANLKTFSGMLFIPEVEQDLSAIPYDMYSRMDEDRFQEYVADYLHFVQDPDLTWGDYHIEPRFFKASDWLKSVLKLSLSEAPCFFQYTGADLDFIHRLKYYTRALNIIITPSKYSGQMHDYKYARAVNKRAEFIMAQREKEYEESEYS